MTDMTERAVLMIYNGYGPNDPDTIHTAQSIEKMGFRITLIGSARQGQNPIPTYQEIGSISVITLPFETRLSLKTIINWVRGLLPTSVQPVGNSVTSLMSMLLFNLWVLRLGLRRTFQVVHCQDLSPLPASWALARLRGAKLVYHTREDFPSRYGGCKGQWVERLERFLVRRSDAVISTGVYLQKLLLERGAREVTLIGNWKRLEDFDIPEEVIRERRAALNLRHDERLIVYVGTLDPSRELMPLLEAVAARPDIRLLIGGRGLLQTDIERFAARMPNIHWLGWVPLSEVPLYSKIADAIYSVWSVGEFEEQNERCPAANKLFESYAAGVPIIVRRGLNEMGKEVERTGAGILVDDASIASLHAAFDLLFDEAAVEQLRARARAQGHLYNWDEAERRLRSVYERLLT
jgi:glycosyltransferase involved in cell wall biosynthesis